MKPDQYLVNAFYRAALFLKARIQNEGWGWSSNYLREHARCAYGLKFSNTQSPAILDELLAQHPELKGLVKVEPRKRKPALYGEPDFDDNDVDYTRRCKQ